MENKVKNSKKKRNLIIISVGLILIVFFICSAYMITFNRFGHSPKQLSSNEGYEGELPNNDILIMYSYSGGWAYTQYGEFILNDGKRYAFTCEKDPNNCRIKEKKSISNKDIKKIKSYESELSDNTESKRNGADMGQTTIMYYNDGTMYTLAGKGDSTIKNNSTGAKKILRILFKYGIYV